MSDLAGASAAMGVPETLVKRSAEARARATGASVDEILAAWAGGGEAPAPAAAASETVTAQSGQDDARPQTPDAGEDPAAAGGEPQTPVVNPEPAPRVSEPASPEVLRRTSGVSVPPVLVGEREGLGVVMTGSLALLTLSLLISVFLPSMQQPGNGIRSSNQAFSSQARAGQDIYSSQGCATCHTQLVRNVVTDVGLGPVTLDDTNQVIGHRRVGPDLAAIGSRTEDTAALISLISGEGDHPAASGLSDSDLADLLAYLRESR